MKEDMTKQEQNGNEVFPFVSCSIMPNMFTRRKEVSAKFRYYDISLRKILQLQKIVSKGKLIHGWIVIDITINNGCECMYESNYIDVSAIYKHALCIND